VDASVENPPDIEGPITILNQTIFRILKGRTDSPDYLHFMGWVYLWGAIFHWVTAALNCQSYRTEFVAIISVFFFSNPDTI
jgi:hypothetical protein